MADSSLPKDMQSGLKNTGTAADVIESKLIAIIRENCAVGVPVDKKSVITVVCNKFRLTERDARRILIALNGAGAIRFGKRRVRIPKEEVI